MEILASVGPITVVRGEKKPGDLVFRIYGYKVPFKPLIYFLSRIYRNENLLYPPPARGGEMLFDAIREAARLDTWEEVSARYDRRFAGNPKKEAK